MRVQDLRLVAPQVAREAPGEARVSEVVLMDNSATHRNARLARFSVLPIILSVAVVATTATDVSARVSRSVRRIARRLDKSFVQINRALVSLDQRSGRARSRRHLRKARTFF